MANRATVAGKYQILDEIGSGGMATVHLARIIGPAGFSRVVAVKRMHEHLARQPSFARMFLEEARLAARIHHPNVVATLDVLLDGDDVVLVLDYVQGESLARLLTATAGRPVPVPVACTILVGVLQGLHAAHEGTGQGVEIVHRDVSPENVLVGADGVPRVLDFGIAKVASRVDSTATGQLHGKLGYMAPEQLRGERIDRRVDVYAAGVVLWEALAGRRLFDRGASPTVVQDVLAGSAPPPSHVAPHVPSALDRVVARALAAAPAARFTTAIEMAQALEAVVPIVSPRAVGEWVRDLAGPAIDARARRLHEIEREPQPDAPAAPALLARRAPADQVTDVAAPGPAPTAPPPEAAATPEPPTATRPRPPRRVAWLVALGAAVAAAFLAAVAAWPSRRPAAEAAAEAIGTPGPAILEGAAPERPALPEPVASASIAPPPPSAPTAKTSPSRRHDRRARPRPSATTTLREGCTPPYVIEPDGTKRFRSECL